MLIHKGNKCSCLNFDKLSEAIMVLGTTMQCFHVIKSYVSWEGASVTKVTWRPHNFTGYYNTLPGLSALDKKKSLVLKYRISAFNEGLGKMSTT